MKFYAELPERAARQVAADLLALAWVILFLVLAGHIHSVLMRLTAPGAGLIDTGTAVSDAFNAAAQSVSLVPFIGETLAATLTHGAAAGQALVGAGRQQIELVSTLANDTALVVVLLGVLVPLVLWLPVRLRYARAAGAAVAARDSDPDLLALRALSNAPLSRLHEVTDRPAAAWRAADPAKIAALAATELTRLGLRAPTLPRESAS